MIKIYFLLLISGFLFSSGRISAQMVQSVDTLPTVIPVNFEQLMNIVREDSGNVVLLNAWASWCKPCQEEMPALVKLQKKYYDSGLRLIFIAVDDTEMVESAIKPILKKNLILFPTYILIETPDDVFIDKMNPKWRGALPASFIYARDGMLIDMMIGGKSYRQFEEAVSKILVR